MAKAFEPTYLCFWGPVSRGLTRPIHWVWCLVVYTVIPWCLMLGGGSTSPTVRTSTFHRCQLFSNTFASQCLTGCWYTTPLKKWWSSSMGRIIPCMKWAIKNVWNHQPAYYSLFLQQELLLSCFLLPIKGLLWWLTYGRESRSRSSFFFRHRIAKLYRSLHVPALHALQPCKLLETNTWVWVEIKALRETTNFSWFSALTIELVRYPKLTHTIPYPHGSVSKPCTPVVHIKIAGIYGCSSH